jgi:hypothetical protein
VVGDVNTDGEWRRSEEAVCTGEEEEKYAS